MGATKLFSWLDLLGHNNRLDYLDLQNLLAPHLTLLVYHSLVFRCFPLFHRFPKFESLGTLLKNHAFECKYYPDPWPTYLPSYCRVGPSKPAQNLLNETKYILISCFQLASAPANSHQVNSLFTKYIYSRYLHICSCLLKSLTILSDATNVSPIW